MDHALLELAQARGAELRTGAHVVDLVRENGAVAGVWLGFGAGRREQIRARLVIGADGLRSVVARRLGVLHRAPRLRKVALTAHVTGASHLEGRGELHIVPGGCVGVADIGGGLFNATVVVDADEAHRIGKGVECYFDAAMRASPSLTHARRVGRVLATGPFDYPVRSAVADGALLVGDAAGYFDPFTGQGIYRALRGAELAASVADVALRTEHPTARDLRPYELARRREFRPGERLQYVIEAFLTRPRLLGPVIARLALRSTVADALIAVTGDILPVRALLAPRIVYDLMRPAG